MLVLLQLVDNENPSFLINVNKGDKQMAGKAKIKKIAKMGKCQTGRIWVESGSKFIINAYNLNVHLIYDLRYYGNSLKPGW